MDLFQNQANRYDGWFQEHPHLLSAEIAAIRQLLPAFRNGVEIGAGTGIFAAQLGIGVGVEPSPNMGAVARSRGVRILEASAECLPLADGAQDLALMVTVDCFLSDVSRAFGEIFRVLAPGGSFVIALLDRETPLGRVYQDHKNEDPIYRHADFHSSGEIRALLQAAGFRVADARQTVFSLEDGPQPVKSGCGEGLFAVLLAEKPKP